MKALGTILRDQAGQTTVEYTLLLGVFVVPMILFLRLALQVLGDQFRFVTFWETLPFP